MAEKTQTGEIDWAKITAMQKEADAYNEEKLKKALVFDPKDVACKAKRIREVYDEDLGTIRYTMLSYNDLQEIVAKHADNQERSVQILFRQLAPASKGLTVDDVRAMPYEVVVRLLVKLQGEGSFFYRKPQATPQTSKEWINVNVTAQNIGLIAHEFGYTLEYIGEMSPFQIRYLEGWLCWYWKQKVKE